MAVDAAGRIYVADSWGDQVRVYDHDHAYLASITSYGSRNRKAIDVEGIAIDGTGVSTWPILKIIEC